MQPDPGAELLDVVDQHNRVVEVLPRRLVHRRGLRHRAVHILLLNPLGDVYVQQRSLDKDMAPGLWDTSAAGHLDSGESYADAAVREFGEELGIPAPGLSELCDFAAGELTGQEFVRVYLAVTELAPRPDPAEIITGQWYAPSILRARIARAPQTFTGVFREIVARWTRLGQAVPD